MSTVDDRESFYRLQYQLEDDMKEADVCFFLLRGVIQYLSVDQVEDFVRYFRRVNDLPEQPKVEKYEDDDLEELEVEEYEDEDGNAIFVIPGVQFTGNEESDLDQLKDPKIYNLVIPSSGQAYYSLPSLLTHRRGRIPLSSPSSCM